MGWTIEDKLLLYCSRLTIDINTKEKIKGILNSALDEDYFTQLCVENGVGGLVYHNLKKMGIDSFISYRVLKDLEGIYYYNIANNMSMFHQLEIVLEVFRKRGIPVVLLQGAALLETIYKDPGLRPLEDIDLLVKARDLGEVEETLMGLGFLSAKNYPNIFVKGAVAFDIHTDIANLSRIRARAYTVKIKNEEIWKDAVSLNPSKDMAFVLSPYDTIIALSVHILKHSYGGLIWFVDINEIIERYRDKLDWNLLVSRAEEFNVQKPLYYSFLYLKKLMNTNLPIQVLDALKPKNMNCLERHLIRLLLDNEKIDRFGDLLFLFNIEKGKERFRFIFETCFPRKEIMHQIFNFSNPYLLWFSYPLRLFQLLLIGTKMSFKLIGKVS
jgi:hypothetical protein